jgi:hypothetical protein
MLLFFKFNSIGHIFKKRLKDLRDEMVLLNLSALIIPLDEDGRLGWISGFSGSAGNSIVTLSKVKIFHSWDM